MSGVVSPIQMEVSEHGNPAVDPAVRNPCPGCSSYLLEPFIKCAECKSKNYLLCLLCFARGFESGKHSNSHAYEIITNDFPVLEYNWSAAEEMRLLDGLTDCGSGNWAAIAKQVRTKTKQECEAHYMKCYVFHARYPLPELPNRPVVKPLPPIPFKACEDPCRPIPESHRAQDMSGYLAARGDFAEEYWNNAECDIKDVYFSQDDWPVLKALKLAMVKIYQSRLKERGRRKRIMREHGLINISNHMLRYTRRLQYDTRMLEERLRPVMRLHHPITHDKMIAGLSLEERLKKKIEKLQHYRLQGITTHRIARLYEKMKRSRAEQEHSSLMSEILPYKNDPGAMLQWLQRQAMGPNSITNAPIIPTVKKITPPIDISDLPGVGKLSQIERHFCETNRLVPEAFLYYKSTLIAENNKTGSLRLAQARNLVKIDVNKTRKIYDFMVEQGHINVVTDNGRN